MANQITPNPSVPSQVVAEVKFPKFINNLGIIPTSYKDSMSYYETLAWLCKFLEEQVIPTVNENGEAVEELQALYVELNSYVTHYFETLDVQEEINNKLDDMVEAGTLQEIIANYLNSKAVFGFDNVASMKEATNLIDGSYAKTLGYHSLNDGGSAYYKIREKTEAEEIDEMKIIQMENNELVAEIIVIGNAVPEMFGAYGDGIHDDSDSINCALTYNLIKFNKKNYKASKRLVGNSNSTIIGNGAIINKTTTQCYLDISSTSNVIIKDLNIIQTEDVYGYLILALHCENLYINNIYLENKESTPSDDAPMMWAMYLSGKKITINNIKIDNYDCGYHADGIHIADIEDLIIDGFNISSGDDCIALNTPRETGNDIVSKNILITNGIASVKRANIFRIDSSDNNTYINACYKNVEISNIIVDMKENNLALFIAFNDLRPELVSTAKHDNIIIKNIIMNGASKYYLSPMIKTSKSDFNHYGKIVLDNIQANYFPIQTRAIEIECDDLTIKNCNFEACYDNNNTLSNENSNFYFKGITNLQLENNKFITKLREQYSIIKVESPYLILKNNILIDKLSASSGFGFRISNAVSLFIQENNCDKVNYLLWYDTTSIIPSEFYYLNNIYNNRGFNINYLEQASKRRMVDPFPLSLYTGNLTCDSNNVLKLSAGTIIHITNQLVITLRHQGTGAIFNAWYDSSVQGFRPVGQTLTEGSTYYAQFWI